MQAIKTLFQAPPTIKFLTDRSRKLLHRLRLLLVLSLMITIMMVVVEAMLVAAMTL